MVEDALSERLKWIRDEYFEGNASALAKAMGCSPGYVTPLLRGKKKNLGHSLMENLVKALGEKPEAGWLTAGWIAGGGPRASHLNDQPATPSNLATLRMLEDEKKEYAAALSWMIGRETKEGEEFAREVWNSKLTTTAKQLLLGAALREQDRRARTATQKN